jgi:hypothetical protein
MELFDLPAWPRDAPSNGPGFWRMTALAEGTSWQDTFSLRSVVLLDPQMPHIREFYLRPERPSFAALIQEVRR